MSSRRRCDHRCTRCSRPTPAKRLTTLNVVEALCPRCLDSIPPGVRRTLLRKEARRVS